jgi:hypothetical protein
MRTREKVTKRRSKTTNDSPTQSRIPPGVYAKRRIQFLCMWKHQKTTFKVYGITTGEAFRSPALVDATLSQAASHLRANPTRHAGYGVGFISVHEGRGENQIIIDRWINENELLHQIYVSSEKTPTNFRRAPYDHNSVCVWELYLQAFERRAWLECVLQSELPWPKRLEQYRASQLNAWV